MKKSLMPIWVVLFSTAAIALFSTHVRSDDALTPLTTDQAAATSSGVSQTANQAASGAKAAAGQTAAQTSTDTSTPASPDSGGGKKGGCCG